MPGYGDRDWAARTDYCPGSGAMVLRKCAQCHAWVAASWEGVFTITADTKPLSKAEATATLLSGVGLVEVVNRPGGGASLSWLTQQWAARKLLGNRERSYLRKHPHDMVAKPIPKERPPAIPVPIQPAF